MAPFNHFGPIYPTPTVPPPSPKRTARGRRLLRDAQAGRVPNTSRGMTSGRDDGPSDQLDIKKSRSSRKLSSFTTSRRSRQRRDDIESESADDVAGVDSDSGDDAPTSTERGLLSDAVAGVGDAVAGVGSAVNSVLDPLVGGKSSTSVAAPEKSSAAAIESKPTAVATSASEPAVVAISSSKESSAAVATSEPALVATSAKEQPSKLPDAPLSSAPSAVALPGTTGVLSPDAAATPTASHVVPNLTRFTPEVTKAFPTPTAQLQSGDHISLSNSQATGAAGQKAQGQAIDSTTDSTTATKPELDSDSDSDHGVDSDDGVESDDELDSDDEKDEPTESRLVAFTTISGTPLSTLSAVLDPTAVGTLPSNVTPVSQTGGGETTVASASAHKPPLTPQASNGLIAFGAVGGVLLFSFVVFFLLRLRKTDAFSCLKCCKGRRKSESNASKSLYHASGIFGTAAPSETTAHSRGFSAFFNPMIQIRADQYEKDASQNQPYSRNSLIQNAAPIAVSQQPMPMTRDEPPPMPVLPLAYRQQAANGNAQRMSEVSSMSSGFGDAVIDIPESGPSTYINNNKAAPGQPKPNNQSLGLDLGPRFSWANVPTPRTLGNHRNRDTATTTTSRDSEPRFRTVTSWVNQQTNRVMKNQDSAPAAPAPGQGRDSVPDLPAIPAAYGGGKHQRMPSAETDVVFKAHPGDEVEIKEGSRIPSTLLTRKLRL
ncbi:hypothetical protein V495_04476 [Pseudogymnoascus sp. VKM F-4514 (FW-929)]|nr:hypothetical protein V495_04476 [Pseudogymnoascus sp. VKM F-4514 (FW-929)]KFY54707.1 hypothetical protein V497_07485 [Pseudogymnoascus sp. VKM F-4516 (FW-969)]